MEISFYWSEKGKDNHNVLNSILQNMHQQRSVVQHIYSYSVTGCSIHVVHAKIKHYVLISSPEPIICTERVRNRITAVQCVWLWNCFTTFPQGKTASVTWPLTHSFLPQTEWTPIKNNTEYILSCLHVDLHTLTVCWQVVITDKNSHQNQRTQIHNTSCLHVAHTLTVTTSQQATTDRGNPHQKSNNTWRRHMIWNDSLKL